MECCHTARRPRDGLPESLVINVHRALGFACNEVKDVPRVTVHRHEEINPIPNREEL